MAEFASGMDFGVVLRLAYDLHHELAFWSGIPITAITGRSLAYPDGA